MFDVVDSNYVSILMLHHFVQSTNTTLLLYFYGRNVNDLANKYYTFPHSISLNSYIFAMLYRIYLSTVYHILWHFVVFRYIFNNFHFHRISTSNYCYIGHNGKFSGYYIVVQLIYSKQRKPSRTRISGCKEVSSD